MSNEKQLKNTLFANIKFDFFIHLKRTKPLFMESIILIIILILLAIILWRMNQKPADNQSLEGKILELSQSLQKIESNLKQDFQLSRNEISNSARENRSELSATLAQFKAEIMQNIGQISQQNESTLRLLNQQLAQSLAQLSTQQQQKLDDLTHKMQTDTDRMRQTVLEAFKIFGDNLDTKLMELNQLQRDKFGQLEKQQSDLVQHTERRLEDIRHTVAEKLEKTLSDRLGQSFETVGKQLIEVQRGLGEMQTIASDVGGLKKVLSNVKLRGGIGEVQLAMILEQTLAPNQYAANVKTKRGSNEPVEFAIKLPGHTEEPHSFVYLPIDAKFPKDTYEHLLAAYDRGHNADIETAVKNLENTIKKMAKDISEKYIDVPQTTDFAIMFLPFEGIYAEVIRRTNLVDQLRQDFKITVAGPTTLVALLNSLQMGFRTLALQKRSSEVWKVLGSVKQEFEKFGGLLEKAQKNFHTGMGHLDELVGKRTKAIQRQLRDVEVLPAAQAPEAPLPDLIEPESFDDI